MSVPCTVDVIHPIDVASLEKWLQLYLPLFLGPISSVTQFRGGQSNPTYKITARSGQLVVRKKPHGTLLKTAHQVDREFRILKALSHTGVPVPRVYALCEDVNVIGTPFYIMEFLEGRVFKDVKLPSLTPAERRAVYADMVRVLGVLHGVDWRALGLEGYGREGNYYRRQLKTWSDNWVKSKTEPTPTMDELIVWLGDNMQPQVRTTIVHGDFR
jgi:aminoglycoside phosphotransferase (APT) family kinase protein